MFKRKERKESIGLVIDQVIDNQIRQNEPPETAITYYRLLSHSFSDQEARRLICLTLQVEIFRLMRYGEAFNNSRFINNLCALPDLPDADLN